MTKQESIKQKKKKKVRTVWDDEQEKWYFSVVDVVGVLTEQIDTEHARNYWKVLKHRLKEEGFEPVTNCHQLKLQAADGKKRLTDVAEPSSPLKKQVITSYPIKTSRIQNVQSFGCTFFVEIELFLIAIL